MPDPVTAHPAFDRADVVARYLADDGLTPCEAALLHRWVAPGATVLDLGVGAGRTTPWLLGRASRYVGIDVAPQMVAAARARFPDADLRVGDAADLGDQATGAWDVVVFAYNGIDYLDDLDRARCLAECRRVLRPGGVLVLSQHSPRAVVATPPAHGSSAGRAARALYGSARRLARLVPTRAFWRGRGWVLDPAQGGLHTHLASRRQATAELRRHGFEVVDGQNGDLPRAPRGWRTPWWYYVARTPATDR